MKYQAVRWTLGGLIVIGIAITQAIFGWVGDGIYFRIAYPVLLLAASSLFFLAGYQAWNFDGTALDGPESTLDAPQENALDISDREPPIG